MRKRILVTGCVLILGAMMLSACRPSAPSGGAELANPASVYCEEQGYTLEIRTDSDGGQYGVCVFADGTECDEWAFYRGECGPGEAAEQAEPDEQAQPTAAPTAAPTEELWVNPARLAGLAGAVGIEILELNMDASTGYVSRATVSDPDAVTQIVAALDADLRLRARARCPSWYRLQFRLADGSMETLDLGCDAENPTFVRGGQDFWQGYDAELPAQLNPLIQAQLARAPQEGTEAVGWHGYVVSLPPGSQYDDYLVLAPEGVGEIGIAGADEAVEAQIVALRDREEPGKYAHFWGTLTCDVPDYGGCQLLVTGLRVETQISEPEPVEGWDGVVVREPPLSQYDDHFVLSGDFMIFYGIDSTDPAVAARLEELRDTMTPIRIWGQVTCGVMDVNGCTIDVARLETTGEPLTGGGE
jgi:putative hemolysin